MAAQVDPWRKTAVDLQWKLEREISSVKVKQSEIERMIHDTDDGIYLRLGFFIPSADNPNLLKHSFIEFNESVFGIKKRVNECERQLQNSYAKLQDFLNARRNAMNVGTTFEFARETDSTIAALYNEAEKKLRELEVTIPILQEQLKEVVDKFKGYVRKLWNKNIRVADW